VRLRKLDLRQPHTYEAAGAEAVLARHRGCDRRAQLGRWSDHAM